jgi:hypothetical protein
MLSAPQTHARELLGITDARVMADKLRAMMISMLEELRHLPERCTDPRWMDRLEEEDGTK